MDQKLNNRDDVTEYMDENMMEYNFGGQLQEFLPARNLDVATSSKVVRHLVAQDSELTLNNQEEDHLLDRIRYSGRKLFAICVYSEIPLLFLKAMLENGLTDSSLPLNSKEQFGSLSSKRKHVNSFITNQKRFNTIYLIENSNVSLDQGSSARFSIPINYNESYDLKGRGAFGEVYEVEIHPDHHTFSSGGNNRFALKSIHTRDEDREKKYHIAMAGLSHSHLVKCLSSFTLGSRYYMIYELAGGDLESFIRTRRIASSKHGLTPPWLAKQLAGLAAALRVVHNPRDTTSRTSNTLGVPQSGKDKTGYIHDIKPDNILVFQYAGNLNWLRLSDFSCAKVNELNETISGNRRSHKTETKSGTPSYRAPEQRRGPTSRPYDLWSLGCVYLEILVWFTEGYEGLEKFRTSREGKAHPAGITDDGFFYETPSGDCLRESVTRKISELSRKCSGDLKLIVDVIPLLLRIKPEERLNASQLALRFNHLDTGVSSLNSAPFAAETLPTRNHGTPKLPSYEGESDEYVKVTRPSR